LPTGVCLSYEVSLCFDNSVSRICSSIDVRSVSTAKVQYVSSSSGPMQPKPFIDDIYLYISNIDSIFLEPLLTKGPISPQVVCNGIVNNNVALTDVDSFDGTASVRINPPTVNIRTMFICFVRLVLVGSQPLQFVERVNVSFAYEAFDDPALSDMQPRGATYESESSVSFVLSSIKITSVNVAFGSKHVPSTSITITNYPDSDSAVVVAKLPLFSLAEALGCFPPSVNCVVAPSFVDTWLNASRIGGAPVNFLQRFELRFPNPPIVRAHGSLIIDINKQSAVA